MASEYLGENVSRMCLPCQLPSRETSDPMILVHGVRNFEPLISFTASKVDFLQHAKQAGSIGRLWLWVRHIRIPLSPPTHMKHILKIVKRKKSPKPPPHLISPGNSADVTPRPSVFQAELDADPEGGYRRY